MTPAYMAGVFDGEGHIELPATGGARVGVEMLWRPIPSAFHRVWGGTLQSSVRHGRRTAWRWRLSGRARVDRFLAAILPYLLEKRGQAHVMIRYCHGEETAREASEELKRLKRMEWRA